MLPEHRIFRRSSSHCIELARDDMQANLTNKVGWGLAASPILGCLRIFIVI